MSKKNQFRIILIPCKFNKFTKNKKCSKQNIIIQNIIQFWNIIVMINLFIQANPTNDIYIIKFNSSVIKLKIKGTGPNNIFCKETPFFKENYYPNEVLINEVMQSEVNFNYNFNNMENIVEMRWNNAIDKTMYMFYQCSYITEIDLSNFDSSEVIDMAGMFYNCSSLTSLDLSNFDTSKVTNMNGMFYGCKLLTSLDITNFITSKVTNLNGVFYNCEGLTSINLQNFDTSQVTNMEGLFFGCTSLIFLDISSFQTSHTKKMGHMFRFCSSLTSLDLSNFDTSQVEDMTAMFYSCKSLKLLNLLHFDTSHVTDMRTMFRYCSSLTSLNIQNFDTSLVICMLYMFSDCSSLTSLDLLSFDTSKVTDMDNLFYNCKSLSSLDLSSFDTSGVKYMNHMFDGCINLQFINRKNFQENNALTNEDMCKNVPGNVVLSLNVNNNNKIISELSNSQCYTIINSNDWESQQKKIIDGSNECIDECYKHESNKFEYNGKCYKDCQSGVTDDNICKCELEMCLFCQKLSLDKELCTKCNDNYYQIENDPSNIGEYFNCYKEPKGYYFDKSDLLYKKCFERCETCETKGDNKVHNCLECNSDYSFPFNFTNYLNCYKNDNITEIMEVIIELYLKNETKVGELEEIKFYDMILENIESIFTSGEYNVTHLDNGTDDIFETDNLLVTLTTTLNQKNNKNLNMISTIDLAECENLLRLNYNLADNQTIYMKKLDIKQEGMKIPKIEFDVYSRLKQANIVQLNLTVCENSKIFLYPHANTSESLEV